MSKFDGALIQEQGITFAVVVVKHYVFTSHNREKIRQEYSQIFGGVPVVLARNTSNGDIEYHGRNDLTNFLSNLYIEQIPWKTYTID